MADGFFVCVQVFFSPFSSCLISLKLSSLASRFVFEFIGEMDLLGLGSILSSSRCQMCEEHASEVRERQWMNGFFFLTKSEFEVII